MSVSLKFGGGGKSYQVFKSKKYKMVVTLHKIAGFFKKMTQLKCKYDDNRYS